MEYLRGFRVAMEDPNWLGKILILSLIVLLTNCLPLIGGILGSAILLGWLGMMMRASVSGINTLPRMDFDLNYLMELAMLGFKLLLVAAIYTIPILVLFGIFYLCTFLGAGGAMSIGSGSDGGLGGILGLVIMIGGLLIMLPITFILSAASYIAMLRVEISEDMSEAWKFSEIIAFLKSMWLDLFLAYIVIMLLAIPLYIIGFIALVIGIIPAMIFLMIALTHIMVQIYQKYLQKGGQPIPVGPLKGIEGVPMHMTPPSTF